MCDRCMDKTSDMLLEETGIREHSLAWLDTLLISAMEIGYRMGLEEKKPDGVPLDGDPLRGLKREFVTYVAGLEKIAWARNDNPALPILADLPLPISPANGLVS